MILVCASFLHGWLGVFFACGRRLLEGGMRGPSGVHEFIQSKGLSRGGTCSSN